MASPKIYYRHFLRIKEDPSLLKSAFTWRATSEGFYFWREENNSKKLSVEGEAALLKYVVDPPKTIEKKPIRWV